MIYIIIVNGPEPGQGSRDWRAVYTDKEQADATFRHLALADDEFAQIIAIYPDGTWSPRLNRWGKVAANRALAPLLGKECLTSPENFDRL